MYLLIQCSDKAKFCKIFLRSVLHRIFLPVKIKFSFVMCWCPKGKCSTETHGCRPDVKPYEMGIHFLLLKRTPYHLGRALGDWNLMCHHISIVSLVGKSSLMMFCRKHKKFLTRRNIKIHWILCDNFIQMANHRRYHLELMWFMFQNIRIKIPDCSLYLSMKIHEQMHHLNQLHISMSKLVRYHQQRCVEIPCWICRRITLQMLHQCRRLLRRAWWVKHLPHILLAFFLLITVLLYRNSHSSLNYPEAMTVHCNIITDLVPIKLFLFPITLDWLLPCIIQHRRNIHIFK